MSATAFPLAWPPAFPRSEKREAGQFKTTLEGALRNVEQSLHRFGVDSRKSVTAIVISSNYTLGVRSPADPGVAVYFAWDGMQVCIPVDRYATLAANLQAIHHIVEARRTELRHGTLHLVRATFRGFAALPAPGRPWRDVLGLEAGATRDQLEAAYRRLAAERHPDRGGSDAMMAELNLAVAEARKATQ
jgi:hypothetical protein